MHRITVEYCPGCGWLARAAWVAQELLGSFSDELEEVALHPAGKGEFRIRLGDETLWDRRIDGGIPDIVALKRGLRDRIAPQRQLGHLDQSKGDKPHG